MKEEETIKAVLNRLELRAISTWYDCLLYFLFTITITFFLFINLYTNNVPSDLFGKIVGILILTFIAIQIMEKKEKDKYVKKYKGYEIVYDLDRSVF